MGKLLAGIIIGGLGVYAYHRAHQPESEVPMQEVASEQVQVRDERPESPPAVEAESSAFRCDGRTHCSQMTSCEEAKYFLEHCPGVKMDGDHGGRGDGIPCEEQWCIGQ